MKKQLFKALSLLLSLFFGLYSIQTKAVPACPDTIHYTQPDGSIVTIFLKGDERVNWAESVDGYTLMKNSLNVYEYAVLDAYGDMEPSGIQAADPANRPQNVSSLLSGIAKGFSYSPSQRSMLLSIMSAVDSVPQLAFPTTGTIKFLIILMQFPDRPFTKTQAEFNNLFNQVGYLSADKGSVRDYYKKESYGQLDIAFTVVGPFTAANNIGYYSTTNSRPLITEAVTQADSYVNFADFDNDNNGTVDGIHMIFAGYGAENGLSGTIWSHAWYINGLSKDGKNIYNYSCSPELKGASGPTTTAIGVACHELGHVLGAPDYYDTNYNTDGQYQGTGYWDMMASGSWLNNGDIPAPHNAYTKVKLYHWGTATELTSPTTVTIPNAEANPSFYIINSTTPNEYWIMENKQGIYWPGHGLLIYHVDKDIDHYGLNGDIYHNGINITHPQRMYPVCANAGTNPTNTSASYGSISTAGCTFPGSGNKTQFTDATLPGMISWAGANTGKPITNIVENTTNKTVTFSFMEGGTNIPVTGVSLNTTSLSLTTGQTSTLAATISPSNATNKNVTWASNNTSVATVSSSGVVTAIAAGTATITVTTADGGKTSTCAVKVSINSSSNLALNKTAVSSSNELFENSELIANYATDGNYSSRWSSAFSDPQWIYVDLGAMYNVTRVKLFWEFSCATSYKIQVSTDASTWTDVYSTTRGDGGTDDLNVTPTNCRYVRMYGTVRYSSYGYSLYEFEVYGDAAVDTQAPTAPTALYSPSKTQTSITLAWTASTDNVGVTGYDVYKNNALIGFVNTNSVNIAGLTASTTYQFFVKARDAADNVSASSNIINVTTSSTSAYCTIKGNTSYFYISNVKIGSINNSSGNNSGYGDFTSISTSMQAGSSQTIQLTSTPFTSSEKWLVWIDYNHDGDFTDSGEEAVSTDLTSSFRTATFTVPSNAVIGSTRMRVARINAGPQVPCGTFADGEAEDYTVNITASSNSFSSKKLVTAIEENKIDSQSFTFYPNPADYELFINPAKDCNIVSVKILDIHGNKLQEWTNPDNLCFDISRLSKGLYVLVVTTDKGKFERKFIKQ